jgi:hypothetical protein
LQLDRDAVRRYAEQSSWGAATRQFVGNLRPNGISAAAWKARSRPLAGARGALLHGAAMRARAR